MNKKTLAFLIILLGLVVLGLIFYFLFFFTYKEDMSILKGEKIIDSLPVGENNVPVNEFSFKPIIKEIKIEKDEKAKPATDEDLERFNLVKIASSFAERFGSYSNHSNFENMTDLEIFMTDKMQNWAVGFVDEARNVEKDIDVYQGVVTRAISTKLEVFNEDKGNATVLVQTQQVKTTGDDNTETSYKDIIIVFEKVNNSWKVDSARWQ